MDPLAALSLAGNVIQFVDFGSKLLSQGYELYISTSGQLAADEELELIIADLSSLISKIRLANLADSQTTTSTTTSPLTSESQQSVFEKICNEAMNIAQEILTKLNTLRMDNSKNREAEILKLLWKRLWSKGEINELLSRLSRLKNVIDTEALWTILQNTNDLKIQTSARFDSLDRQT